MRTIFNHLKFNREIEATNFTKKSKWEMFVPGINSGVYSPASLAIHVRVEDTRGGFFSLKRTVSNVSITLNQKEFDALYDEMTKIKNLRDNENISGK